MIVVTEKIILSIFLTSKIFKQKSFFIVTAAKLMTPFNLLFCRVKTTTITTMSPLLVFFVEKKD